MTIQMTIEEAEKFIADAREKIRVLLEENRRLKLELAEANDLCEHLRDKLEGKAK